MTSSPISLLRAPSSLWSVAALAAGLAAGTVGHALGWAVFQDVATAVKPIGQVWISALLAMVIPLVIVSTLAAVTGMPRDESAGALGGRAVLLFTAMLAIGGLFTMLVGPLIVSLFHVDTAAVASLTAATPVPDAARQVTLAAGGGTLSDWLTGLIPQNLFEAARKGDMLPLLLFALLIGVAITRLPDEHREPLTRLFQALAAAMFICIGWLLWLVPLGVFIYTYLFVLHVGVLGAGVVGGFIVVVSAMVVLCTILLYPVTVILGRTTLREFAHAVAPAQVVALSTSSSLASLPALVQGARDRLRLPASAHGLVLPLAVSIFKANRTISSTIKLLFLAHVYGIHLSGGTLASFLLTVMVLSFSTLGLPGGASSFKTAPAYLAAGIPIEALVITEAAETIPDLFKTVFNVTANMSAATLLSRASRKRGRVSTPATESQPATGAT